jgi:hypothetical protein
MKVKIVALIVPILMIATTNVAKAQQNVASTVASAKEADAEKSNIEKFIISRGKLLVKKFGTIGELEGKYRGKVQIETLILSTPANSGSNSIYGVRFERPAVEKFESDDTGFIDFDESKGLIEAAKYMVSLAEKMKTENHENTEVEYKSRGGIVLGFFQSRGEQTAYIKVERKNVFMDMKQFATLQNLIETAVSSLVKEGAK